MADRRLHVFYTVARLLSFTKAAETLHMTSAATWPTLVIQLSDVFGINVHVLSDVELQ